MAEDAPFQDVQGASGSGTGTGTKLFLGGLSWETTEEKLKEHFNKYGEIESVIVMKDRQTNKPRGFGFITFMSEEAAQKAMQEQHTLDGRTIDAKPSVPQGEGQRPRSKKIFVGGLSPETTEENFKAYFQEYGKVTEAQIMVDHQSLRSRGFGFVTFEDEAAVNKVFQDGVRHRILGKEVEVKNATPKGSGPQGGRGGGRGGYPGRDFGGGRGYEYPPLQGQYAGYVQPGGYSMMGNAYYPAAYGGYTVMSPAAYGPAYGSPYGNYQPAYASHGSPVARRSPAHQPQQLVQQLPGPGGPHHLPATLQQQPQMQQHAPQQPAQQQQ